MEVGAGSGDNKASAVFMLLWACEAKVALPRRSVSPEESANL